MAINPIASTTGDPVFRAQNSSISAIRQFSRNAADASVKLNTQERIVSPGDDSLSFSTSRRIRSDISTLKTLQESGQLNITGLGLAIDGLEGIKAQLDKVKKNLVQSQVADETDRAGIQSEIDLALAQIDSAARNTKLGSRSLLDGSASIQAFRSVQANGTVADFSINNGTSLTQSSGIQGVRVNKLGTGGTVRTLSDGSSVLSVQVKITSANKTNRAVFSLSTGGGGSASFAEFRVTGKLGSTTIRVNSTAVSLANLGSQVDGFNALAADTGVVISSGRAGGAVFTTVGFGGDEFIKIELINESTDNTGVVLSAAAGVNVGGSTDSVGTSATAYGRAVTAQINGSNVQLGGPTGTTARYVANGFDVEIDFSTVDLEDNQSSLNRNFVVKLDQGVTGLLGTSANSGDKIQYGFGNFTTEALGRGNAQYTITQVSTNHGRIGAAFPLRTDGQQIINQTSVAEVGSGGRLSLNSGQLSEALRTVDRAIDQVINEQTRLGSIQGAFIDSVNRAQVAFGTLTSADADIIGVDAATEITNLVQSQLGVSTASALLSQANTIQATVSSLIRG